MNSNKYQRAEKFLPWNLHNVVFNSTIFPYWTDGALYYFQASKTGHILVRVDLITGKKENIFEFKKLIEILSSKLNHEVDFEDLPLDKFSVTENSLQLHFSYKKTYWTYDLLNHSCAQCLDVAPEYLASPDKNWALWIQDYNVILKDIKLKKDYQLTTDGIQNYSYASSPETNTSAITQLLEGGKPVPVALWSSDSKKIVTHKVDQREVRSLHLLQNASEESRRPIVHEYRMSFSGDSVLPCAELVVVDVASRKVTPLKTNSLLSPYLTPLEFKWVWWSADNTKIYFLHESRAAKELILCMADAETGVTKTLISESMPTYVEPSQFCPWPHQIQILEDSQEVIWLSERDGYAHLYLYDIGSNIAKSVITKGEWCVRSVHFYDVENDWLYFTATGYNKIFDPYYKQLFRCRLDGSQLECLTPENANHTVSFSTQKDCFLDTFSIINTAPVSILRCINGGVICDIEKADLTALIELEWVPPLRFSIKARDGVTDIYGNLYFPSDFDVNKKYPVIDHIYPGPQFYRTPIDFNFYGAIFRSAWIAQALAELGFIVMHVDGFGTPGRSKAFHDMTYENMGDCGIPDHVTAIKQLAKKYNYIDIDRVGVTGYSGGGYAAARAMLTYPEFYKVGVAAAGNHDLRCYPANYGEKYNGLNIATYASQSNAMLADKLEGSLLLIHGELDDNVHPCATMQLVDALIKHNKDFDMLIMPNQNHTTTFDHPYYMRRQWDYFIRHLLGEPMKTKHLISSIPTEFPQLSDW